MSFPPHQDIKPKSVLSYDEIREAIRNNSILQMIFQERMRMVNEIINIGRPLRCNYFNKFDSWDEPDG